MTQLQVHQDRRPTCQAHLGERDPVVTSIDFGGRPHALFGSRHGSHTTAWVVMCDAVRTAVLKPPVMDAIGRLEQLIAEASALPGADRWRVCGHAAAKAEADGAAESCKAWQAALGELRDRFGLSLGVGAVERPAVVIGG